jgi:hypothetical protein
MHSYGFENVDAHGIERCYWRPWMVNIMMYTNGPRLTDVQMIMRMSSYFIEIMTKSLARAGATQ